MHANSEYNVLYMDFFFIDIRLFGYSGVLCLLFFDFLVLYTEYFSYSCTEYKDDT